MLVLHNNSTINVSDAVPILPNLSFLSGFASSHPCLLGLARTMRALCTPAIAAWLDGCKRAHEAHTGPERSQNPATYLCPWKVSWGMPNIRHDLNTGCSNRQLEHSQQARPADEIAACFGPFRSYNLSSVCGVEITKGCMKVLLYAF